MDCKPIRLVTHTTRFLRGTQVSRGPVGEAHGTGAPRHPGEALKLAGVIGKAQGRALRAKRK